MNRFILITITLICLFTGYSASGQSKLTGTVIDSATMEPLPFVNIILQRPDGIQAAGSTTNFDGKYTLTPLTPGKYDLKASYVGYKPVTIKSIKISSDSLTVNIKLALNLEGMENFVVTCYSVGIAGTNKNRTGSSAGYSNMGGVVPDRNVNSDSRFRPGQLTASELNDFSKWELWKEIKQEDLKDMQDFWKLNPVYRYSVQVKGNDNRPLPDAATELVDNKGSVIWRSRTDNTGKAELWSGMTDGKNKHVKSIRVIYESETYTHYDPHDFSSGINLMILPVQCNEPSTTDIMFVVDATGSMDDEIVYLKSELDDIISSVKESNPALNTRTASVFYCADGNPVETVFTDFSSDQSVTSAFVKAQNHNCGGEEVVDKALELAVSLNWSKSSHARIMFFLLDAPPFRDSESVSRLQTATLLAAEKGIRVIPVVASVEEMTMGLPLEYLMRSIALATNGTYVFITDHSNIGDEHATPVTDTYDVELLNDAIKRLINQYTYYPPCDLIVEQGIQDTTVLFAKKIIAHEVVDSTRIIASVNPESVIVDFRQVNPTQLIQDSTGANPAADLSQQTGNPGQSEAEIPSNTPFIKYFPNPTQGELTVLVSGDIKELYILDISGKLLQVVKTQPITHISLADYSSGIYFIRFQADGRNVTGKVVLQ